MTDLSAEPSRPVSAFADGRLQVLAAELERVKAEQEADAAERRRLREELRELTRQHELVINAAGEGIIGLDSEGHFSFANPAVARMTGWALQDLIGRPMHETVHHKHPDGTPYPIEDCPMHAGYTAGVAQHVRDALFWRRDGSSFPVEYICTPIRERGEVVGAVVVVRDITEQKRAEEALRRSQESFETLVNTVDGIVWEASGLNYEYTFISKQAERLLGYPTARWLKESTFWRDHMHPDDRERIMALASRAIAERRDHVFEYRMVGADGQVVWVRDVVRVLDEPDRPVVLRGVMVDITDLKLAEEALRQTHDELEARVHTRTAALAAANDALRGSEERYRVVAETASDAIVTIDEGSTVLFVNPAAEKIFGHAREEMLGQELTMLMPEAMRILHKLGLRRYVETGERRMDWQAVQVPGLHQDGREIPLEVSFGEMEHEGRQLFTGIVRDISDRKLAERRLAACYTVTQLLAATASEAVYSDVLRVVGEALDWSWGELWLHSPDDTLRPAASWRAAAAPASEFGEVTAGMRFVTGVGLPGRVWQGGVPVWIPDVVEDDNFPRSPQAAAAGLHAALAFPICSGDAFYGVMGFFSREIRPQDEHLLDLMASIGLQVGQHIALQRLRAS